MTATVAIDGINAAQGRGWRIKGRRIRLDQGARKPDAEDEDEDAMSESWRRAACARSCR